MQLCCTMKNGANIIQTKFQRIGSLLLILLFLFVAAAPLLHHHEHCERSEHVNVGSDENIQLTDKCAVCDYCHHIQGQQILLYYPQLQIIINTNAITLDNRALVSNYKFTLQGFTNKGPPALRS